MNDVTEQIEHLLELRARARILLALAVVAFWTAAVGVLTEPPSGTRNLLNVLAGGLLYLVWRWRLVLRQVSDLLDEAEA